MPLSGLRVLDLAGATAPLCGQTLALLGASVVLAGDEAEAPTADPLPWLAYNIGKQRLTGGEQIEQLAALADVLIAGPGAAVPDGLAQANPALVWLQVSPYGMEGPRSGWQTAELIAQAAGGLLNGSRQLGLPPAKIAIPIAACAAGIQGTVAVLLALRRRRETGAGAFIDLSLQEAITSLVYTQHIAAFVERQTGRPVAQPARPGQQRRALWECQDGYVVWNLWTGPGWGRKNLPFVEWMNEEGTGQEMRDVPWEALSLHNLDPEQMAAWQTTSGEFFRRFPKRRLAEEAVKRRILLYPQNTMSEIAADKQLEERGAFVDVELLDGRTARPVGRPFRTTAYDARLVGRAEDAHLTADAVLGRWRNAATEDAADGRKDGGTGLPLNGVRVLDFSWLVAGPVTTKLLGFFGADVVKIESRKRPDATRMTGPYPRGKPSMNGSAHFASVNAGKRSIGLDISHPDANDLLLRLGAVADIVAENFTPGTLERHGLGYEAFRAVKPHIIMISLSLQGATGYRATQPGIGSHIQALSGLDDLTGFPEAPPAGAGTLLPDFIGPWFSATALLAALEHRRRTGEGQYLDVSQLETLMMFMQPELLRAQLTGQAPKRQGNRVPDASPHGVYPVRDDKWLALAAQTDAQWQALWELLSPDVRSRFARDRGLPERLAESDALDEAIAFWTREQDGERLAEQLQARGIPAYVVNTGPMMLDDPQLAARNHFRFPVFGTLGETLVDSPPLRIDRIEPRIAAAPLYAESTSNVLHDWLGLGEDDVADLLASGVVTMDA